MSFKINVNSFFAGDTISANIVSTDYNSKDYKLVLIAINAKNSYSFDTVANENGSFDLSIISDISKDLVPSNYRLFFVINKDEFVKQIDGPLLEIKPNIIDSTVLDLRSEAQKRLEVIRDLLDGRLVDGVNNFSINGRSVTLMSMTDLHNLEREYEYKVSEELKLNELKNNGRTNRNKLKIIYRGINV